MNYVPSGFLAIIYYNVSGGGIAEQNAILTESNNNILTENNSLILTEKG